MVVETRTDRPLLKQIDALQLTERLKAWKDARLKAERKVCTERAKLAMKSWRDSEGEDLNIRRAKLLQTLLEGVPIAIHDWDLVVGRETEHLLGANPYLDISGDYLKGLMEGAEISVQGPQNRGVLSEQEREVLRECVRFWAGKTVGDHIEKAWRAAVGTWESDWVEAKGKIPTARWGIFTFGIPNWDKVLSKGLRGIIQEAKASIRRFRETNDSDIEKLYFWQAAIIACRAAISHAHRYAKLARRLAQEEADTERRRELEEVASICERVPEHPARTFHEAIQSMVLVAVAVKLECPTMPALTCRLDQLLWPYFENDVREGKLTLEKAVDLVGGFIAFLSTQVRVDQIAYQDFDQGGTQIVQVTVGGVKSNGEDAANDLSYLILHVVGLLRTPEPHVTFRWHPGTPRWLFLKGLETNAKTHGGIPQFVSDVHVVQDWMRRGAPLEAARDWRGWGCVGTLAPNTICSISDGQTNLPLVLDLVLHNGVAPRTGKLIGLRTGDPRSFKTFEDLLNAFKKQVQFITPRALWLSFLGWGVQEQYMRRPLYSALLSTCMERGKDSLCRTREGYSIQAGDRGVVDTGDSLFAIKKLVFDDKKLTIKELLQAIDSNFEGERGEEVRRLCLAAPKFGNDIDEVDEMVRDIGSLSASVIASQKNPIGIAPTTHRTGLAWHFYGGEGGGGPPHGRRAGEPLNDGSISPMRGMDKLGPTATLRSVLKALTKEADSTCLNLKFSATLMRSPKNREKLAALTETFLRNGGQHIQYNMVDSETLRKAKEHPEAYQDLLVRVGGFSAYFVHLSPEVQDDIIARTDQGL